jgi:NodT family efflux transporter outer membrane factor (OMF) lipoprotein
MNDKDLSRTRRTSALRSLLPCAFGLLAACTVGPDFEPPAAPTVTSYRAAPEIEQTAAVAAGGSGVQRFVRERDIPAEWWQLFESPALDALVQQALSDSPSLEQAEARLALAQAELEAKSGGSRLPQVGLNATTNRVDVESGEVSAPALSDEFPLSLSVASVGVSYSLDLFGRNRRELEALAASVDYERFELEAARLMLAGNVVAAAIEEASLRQQLEATLAAIELQTRQLGILEELEQLGAVPRLDLVMQSGELARTRSTLPVLEQQIESMRHRLAVLLGQPPGSVTLPELELGVDLQLPTELPLSLPSALARQRPDIRAAEALLHEATARVGAAQANFYPDITLSATAGGVAVAPFISGTAGFALLAASIAQPLFSGGALRAEEQAAEAVFAQAGAAYQEVVLSALQDVADTLAALDADARILRERSEAARFAETAYGIASQQYEAGGVSLLTLLEAERNFVASSIDETEALGIRFAHSAALFQALGGGWWSEETAAP